MTDRLTTPADIDPAGATDATNYTPFERTI